MTMIRKLPTWTAPLALWALAAPASAQWTRVADVPVGDVHAVYANGDTIVACGNSAVDVSVDAGATWKRSSPVAPNLNFVSTALVYNGRLYVGTDRQGVFFSDDLGTTWTGYSTGFAGLGALDIAKLIVRGDSLYAATVGGGPWVRSLVSGPWVHFGDVIDAAQAGNMTTIAAGGSRLLGVGGFNGTVYYRDPAQSDWSESRLLNDRLGPGLAGLSAIWTGSRWVVGSNIGVYHSATGQEPWTYVDFGVSPILFSGVAMRGGDVFVSLGAGGGSLITRSRDGGLTWETTDTLVQVFVYDIAIQGGTLYAGRVDGLWRRSVLQMVSAPAPESDHPRLSFAIEGRHPVGDRVRFTFELPEAGPIAIEVFDVAGRRVGSTIREARSAGRGEVGWDASGLVGGVYHARLTTAGGQAVTRLVYVR
jgi:hypothetical protein